ncbi:hypothetical protein [Alysiella filiformis]|uniref:hypothetical protein n=1 Tax=Alysiella filiformis TaxID=194196 RepID=UPI0015CEE9D8|nr:hypothetical protein [Alysiella filiformis]QMT30496.1 hypothetical protein H3L97_06960 [Alysiella filiformis]UBQ56523.1 hypothetical protein JF568_01720 [Alysiella filiformis DSM 16848]
MQIIAFPTTLPESTLAFSGSVDFFSGKGKIVLPCAPFMVRQAHFYKKKRL